MIGWYMTKSIEEDNGWNWIDEIDSEKQFQITSNTTKICDYDRDRNRLYNDAANLNDEVNQNQWQRFQIYVLQS